MNAPQAILLVDDNVHGMVARRRVLKNEGFEVQTARSAEEALQLIDGGQSFALVVTDYRMGGMDGIQLISHLRGVAPNTRTILLSAFVDSWGLTAENTGADAVIMKSANEIAQLTRTVQNLLTKRKPVSSLKKTLKTNVVKNG